MLRPIPCVITARDADGCTTLVATTHTYWGAKRLVKLLVEYTPARTYAINEVWNSPMLRSVTER